MFEPILEGIANYYFWDFGDGDTSTLRNPIHTFTAQGKYNVKFKVRLELDDCNQVDSMIKENYVVVNDLEAKFTAQPTAGIAPLTVQFSDSSSGYPSSWFWNFGDEHTSTEQNPQHQYGSAGIYDVFLRVSNFVGVDSLLKLDHILVTDTLFPDLFAEIYGSLARPGFDLNYFFYWTNTGTNTAENCSLLILLPQEMTFYNVFAGDIRTGTYSGYGYDSTGETIIIPLAGIDPSNWYGGYVYATGNLPASVPIGDGLVCQSWLTSTTPEQNYTNNHAKFSQVVVGSWDPNDKLAYPEGVGASHEIEPDQRVEYMIRFENKPEATADAIYIRVVDTLDYDLNWGSLAIGASSHPDKCNYEFDPYTGEIIWFCDSIMLPPNQNPPEGEGYFTFSISPKSDLQEGTELTNSAWIRFDYNPWLQAPEEGAVIRTIHYPFIRGDANGDGMITAADIVYLINYLFIGGPAPQPLAAGDANCDGVVSVSDVVYLINYLFIGGPPPGC
jgi:PKD repeat protein